MLLRRRVLLRPAEALAAGREDHAMGRDAASDAAALAGSQALEVARRAWVTRSALLGRWSCGAGARRRRPSIVARRSPT